MTPTLGNQAFALARRGKTWAEIAATLGATYQQVYRAAPPVAPETACAPTLWHYGSRGEYAYTERGKGRSWRDIGQALGHPWEVATHRAHQHARDYATARALPWPPVAIPGAEQGATKGQRAYDLRRAGRWWGEIGKALEMPRKGSAHDAAERYAYANGLPWPPE